MKQILLMIAVVGLVGCEKKDDGNTGVVNPNKPSPKAVPEKLITDKNKLIIEKEIRNRIEKPTGELTEADLEKVTYLFLMGMNVNKLTSVKGVEKCTQLTRLDLGYNKLTDVKDLEKLTKLEYLNLFGNNSLGKDQIDALKKALPKCRINSNHGLGLP